MKEYKILFTGPMGAGKTTAIAAISETPPVRTDVVNTDPSSAKEMTTVGLDYGLVTLDAGDRVRLFGTPGQVRFDFLWQILARNALGLVILLDHSREAPLQDLATYLDGFREELGKIACVVGVGRCAPTDGAALDAYSEVLSAHGLILPVLAVDVRQRQDVLLLLDTLLSLIEVQMVAP